MVIATLIFHLIKLILTSFIAAHLTLSYLVDVALLFVHSPIIALRHARVMGRSHVVNITFVVVRHFLINYKLSFTPLNFIY